ncbi:MAG: tetratricopeptide repeat protein [Calditrichaeota bacterium]|nr:MAG: tetratricopeptide repeat protein [Calditrichota bacterium]
MFRNVAKEELRVPGKVEYLGELRDFVTRVGKKYGFSERVINAFKLSIDEAATNIIKHAYRDWSGDITLRAVAKKSSLTMVLIDQGKYFDPRQVNDPDLQRYVEIGKRGGLGIFIMRRLLDSIDYHKSEEGNELWMVKNRDEIRRTRITFTAIPLTLKMRYWLYSLTIVTALLLVILLYNFFHQRDSILEDYILQGKTACSYLEGEVGNRWETIDSEVINYLKTNGSYDIEIRTGADDGIKTLVNSEHRNIIKEVILTDKRSVILASSDSTRTIWEEKFQIPNDAKQLEQDSQSTVYLLNEKEKSPILNIIWPIKGEDGERLADIQLQIDYRRIQKETNRNSLSLVYNTFLIWLIVSAGLFMLIYVVLNPFKRLQDWVKHLNEPGVVDDMDIDATSEIGAIAQAFSDMTVQLRKSQVDLVEQERLQQEMHIAKQIQQTLLPSEFPELEGYDIASYYGAAKEVGGDFFDFVEVDKDTLGVAVADVSGKGVPGAFVMTMIRTALRSEARGVKDAAEVLAKVNDFVVNDMKKGMFVTLFYVIIDSKRRRLNFASAGHNPMILHRPSKNKTYYLNPRGFPIGISLPDKELFRRSIESDTIALAEDDILLVYTDGVTEAMNPKRKMFGEERFLRLIRDCGKKSASEFVELLTKEMGSFTEGNEQNDDITLVAIKEKTSAEKIDYDRAVRAYTLIQSGVGIKEACRDSGISTYSYYQKYKDKFNKDGVESFVIEIGVDQVEEKHLSIEEKNKIYDVIRRNPEFGAKRISEELNTERYDFCIIPVSKIYEELVHMRLNTKQLRESFIMRGGRKKRIKPPGTPLLTVDGRVIINRAQFEEAEEEEEQLEAAKKEEAKAPVVPVSSSPQELTNESTDDLSERNVFQIDRSKLLTDPLEDLLDKRKQNEEVPVVNADQNAFSAEEETDSFWQLVEASEHAEEFGEPSERTNPLNEQENIDSANVVTEEQIRQSEEFEKLELEENETKESLFFSGDTDLEFLANFEFTDQEDSFFAFAVDEQDDTIETNTAEKDEPTAALDDGETEELPLAANSVDAIDDPTEKIADEKYPLTSPATSAAEEDDETESWDSLINETSDSLSENDLEFENAAVDEFESQDKSDEPYIELAALEKENGLDDAIFKDLLPGEKGVFDLWATDQGDTEVLKFDNADHAPAFDDSPELLDPFEEFLQIDEEQGLLDQQGELEFDDQIFENPIKYAESEEADDGEGETLQISEVPRSDDEVNRREREDDSISLDELVSISDNQEPLFAQEDEEFDNLLLDAVSNDDKVREIFKNQTHSEDEMKRMDDIQFDHDYLEAITLYQEHRYSDAIWKMQKLSTRYPKDQRLYSQLGLAYFRVGNFEGAARAYERVIDLDPLNEKACENLATVYANQGDLRKAILQWERLLKIAPTRNDVMNRIQKAKVFLEKI